MKGPKESDRAGTVFGLSLSLFALTLLVWIVEGYRLSGAGTGGDAGFAVLGDQIRLVLICFCGIFISWIMAMVATKRSKRCFWLAIVESPFMLVATGLVIQLFLG